MHSGNKNTPAVTNDIMKLLIAPLLLLLCLQASAEDFQHLQALKHTEYRAVDSDVLERRLHVYVMLPESYDATDENEYPTIYVLDGGALFPMFAAYYRYLNFGEEIPDAIIVGISYGSDNFDGGNFRSTDFTAASAERDYWGGAPKYQAFLSDELMPMIERRYRSNSKRRIIFGQSLGGQFVLYTALTRPGLFWGHIASNPALHRNLPFFLEQQWAADAQGGRLYVASGTEDTPRFREPALEWIEHWQERDSLPWQLEIEHLQGHSHMSAPPAAFRNGMRWLFSDEQ